jgi:hypothetical protein
VSGTYVVGETVTGSGSALTAEVYSISSDHLIVRALTGGTTWTDGETITGGTSGATSVLSGTGQDEDILVTTNTAPSSTFTVPAVTFKTYAIEIDANMLTDGYKAVRVCLSDPGTATIAGGAIIGSKPTTKGAPMPSVIGTGKISATNT